TVPRTGTAAPRPAAPTKALSAETTKTESYVPMEPVILETADLLPQANTAIPAAIKTVARTKRRQAGSARVKSIWRLWWVYALAGLGAILLAVLIIVLILAFR